MAMKVIAVVFALCTLAGHGLTVQTSEGETHRANPIRKVVTMLQMMQKKIEAEAKKEEELYDKFMCYCKNGESTLSAAIDSSTAKVPQVQSDIESAESQKAQFEEDVKTARVDRDAAKAAIMEATALREKEATTFATYKAEQEATIEATAKATAAVDKGLGSSFLQTNDGQILKKVLDSVDMAEADRQDVVSFLSGTNDEDAPAGGSLEIVGILKTMKEKFEADLAEATKTEETAVKTYDELVTAKKKEIEALTSEIEEKTVRIGDLGVDIVMMKEDLSDTEEQLIEDKKFLADLDKNCKVKAEEWAEVCKMRAEEQLAIADTIKILNDDDALELFKKTLPGAASSFVQMKVSAASMKARALAMLHDLRNSADKSSKSRLDFILLCLSGKAQGFEKVIKMVDDMVEVLKTEQQDDAHKKEYCEEQIDITEDKQKVLTKVKSDTETAIAESEEGITTLTSEIAALEDGIKALDKSVVEATEQRKEESEDFQALMASDTTAQDLLEFAKNRLNKFYNPKLYKPPPKRELTEEEKITLNMGGTLAPTAAPGGIAGTGIGFLQVHQQKSALEPPPAAPGAYKSKSEESGGVIAMIDMMIKDLEKEMTVAKTDEKNAQEDYEQMMSDSAEKRAEDTKSLTMKASAKASLESQLQAHQDKLAATGKELMAVGGYLASIHGECDWLLEYFDARKAARTAEIDALGKAKAVLSGADYSLLQVN